MFGVVPMHPACHLLPSAVSLTLSLPPIIPLPTLQFLPPSLPPQPFSPTETWKRLFIGGLDYSTTEAGLRTHFERFGPVQGVTVVRDKMTKESRGFGFVVFRRTDSAKRAMTFPRTMLDGRSVELKYAFGPNRQTKATNDETIPQTIEKSNEDARPGISKIAPTGRMSVNPIVPSELVGAPLIHMATPYYRGTPFVYQIQTMAAMGQMILQPLHLEPSHAELQLWTTFPHSMFPSFKQITPIYYN